MSLFARGMTTRAFGDRLSEIMAEERGASTYAGPTVTEGSAMRLAAVWSCVNLLADIVSTFPVQQFAAPGEEMELAPVIAEPSATVDPIGWRRQAMVSWLLRGNVYGIETSTLPSGWPRLVEIAHPDWIGAHQERRLGPIEWSLNGKKLDAATMRHAAAFTVPGSPLGLSPIGQTRQSIGLGLAVQEYGARWFGDGAHPSALLKTEKPVNEEQAKTIKQRFLDAIRGKREPLVVGLGMSYEAIQVAPNESQFLETIKANRTEIAAIFLPHLILSETATMTYTNVESRSLDLLVFDVQPWLVRLEAWLSRMIPRGQTVKFNTDDLVRTTFKDRIEAEVAAVKGGIFSPDDARAMEDKPPIPDGKGKVWLWPPAGAGLAKEPDPASREDRSVHVTLPEQHHAAPVVNLTVPPSDVHVAAPDVRVDIPAPDVHVEVAAPEIRVDIPAPDVHVRVDAPNVEVPVTVQVPPVKPMRRRIERDAAGRPAATIEEPIDE